MAGQFPGTNFGSFGHDDLSQSNSSNLQWPAGLSFQQSLMLASNPSVYYPHHGQEGTSQPDGSRHEDEFDLSQPSHLDPSHHSTLENCNVGRGGNWSVLEDNRLCHAWVRVSTDAIVGSSQKKKSFWSRIFEDFVLQHGDKETTTRSQKGCNLRMQHIRGELNKWSAALKKVQDCPRSGSNELMQERTAHAFYRGQNGNKGFKLQHCWEILRQCAKFMQSLEPKSSKNAESNPTPTSCRPSVADLHVDDHTPVVIVDMPDRAPAPSPVAPSSDDLQTAEASPLVRARPLGRKSSKERVRAKRQASSEAQSAIGEKVAKSLDDLQVASSVGWQRANELNEEEQSYSIKHKKLQMIQTRLAIECQMIQAEKDLYEIDPTAIGTPTSRALLVAERKRRLASLQEQADAFAEESSCGSAKSSRLLMEENDI